MIRSVVMGCLLLGFLPATDVFAQVRSVATGLRLNVHAGAAVLDAGGGREFGVRPGVSAGYGNSRLFHVFMTYDRAPMHDGVHRFDLRHLDAGVRVHVRGPGAALVPFVIATYTWRTADYGEIMFLGDLGDVKVHGGGISLGAGASHHITPRLAVELSLYRSGAPMDRVNVDGLVFRNEESSIRGTSWRLNAGLSWWLLRRPQPGDRNGGDPGGL